MCLDVGGSLLDHFPGYSLQASVSTSVRQGYYSSQSFKWSLVIVPFSWWVLILKPLLIQKWEVGGFHDPVLSMHHFFDFSYILAFQSCFKFGFQPCFKLKFFKISIRGKLLYNIVFVCAIQRRKAAISTHVTLPSWASLLHSPHTPHPFRSSQSTRLGSLCYTAKYHQRSVSHTTVYICTLIASLIAQLLKNLPGMQEILVWFLSREDLLEKG